MKTLLFHFILTIALSASVLLETVAQNQLNPMSINRKDKTAFGLVQAGSEATGAVTWTIGKNTFSFPGSSIKFAATVNESFTLVELMLQSNKVPVSFSLMTPPEGYTNPESTLYYSFDYTETSGKVIKGVLAICWAENAPSFPNVDYLPYWPDSK